jgi:hypothetical protein
MGESNIAKTRLCLDDGTMGRTILNEMAKGIKAILLWSFIATSEASVFGERG